jgi:hypothetical protein
MKNIIIGIFIGFITCGCIWFLDSLQFSEEEILIENAFVTILNESDFNITKVDLRHEYGALSVSNVGIGKTAYLGFYNVGENSYTLTVELENGDILKSIGTYFERGLRATETVSNSEIIQENNW